MPLEGESKAIVQAFDNQWIMLLLVKQRLVRLITSRNTMGNCAVTDVLGGKRLPNQSVYA